MATQLLSPIGILVQQLANSGQPLTGGQIFIYQAGTTTPITTYTDSTGGTPNANPIVLNSAGRLPNVSVWVPSNTPHKMVLEDANNVTLSTIDQLYGINDPFLINQVSTTLPTGAGTANAQTVTNSVAITAQGNGTEQWYTPGIANTGDTTINVDGLGPMHAHYLNKVLSGGELQVGVPVLIKSDGTFWNLGWSAKGAASDTYTDTGTVNALAITVNAAQTTMATLVGSRFKVKVANTTTSSTPTIAINGLGAINISLSDGATTPPAGSMILNGYYDFIVASATSVILENPSRVTGSGTVTQTGYASPPTLTLNYAIEPSGKLAEAWTTSNTTGTSNATTMTWTGIPAALTTATSHRLYGSAQDNGAAFTITGIDTGTGTTWTWIGGLNTGSWTAAGAKTTVQGSWIIPLS